MLQAFPNKELLLFSSKKLLNLKLLKLASIFLLFSYFFIPSFVKSNTFLSSILEELFSINPFNI